VGKASVLIVEDDLIIASHISSVITESDYNVAEILTKGESALGYLSKNTVDIILLDINLAGELNGIDTAKQIMNKYGTPVIFLTGNDDKTTFDEAKEAYPFGFITKPFKNEDLTTVNIKAIEELNDNYVFINGKSLAISKSHKQELAERLTLV